MANWGGGVHHGNLTNCTLNNNTANWEGGGAYLATLNSCTLSGNLAFAYGGGASGGALNNCTLDGNSAGSAGGAFRGALNNCIIYYNHSFTYANFDPSSILNYCCTMPLPASGTGNITNAPQLASLSHLSTSSPCRGAGSAAYSQGVDIDGEGWLNPPSIGCDEYHSDLVTGMPIVAIGASYTNMPAGFEVNFQTLIDGMISSSSWDFGNGVIVSNQPYASHSWAALGDYPVSLKAWNDSNPAGVRATIIVHVIAQPVHYVAISNGSPNAPYSSWATAATNIQDAVDAASVPGALILVSNGVYRAGGRAVYGLLTNRVAVTKPLTLQSVNGPQVTMIVGQQVPGTTNGSTAVRCVYLNNGAVLSGFTLTNGATLRAGDTSREQSGGGVWCESGALVSNCVVIGNSAYFDGGGVYQSTLNNCTVISNSASVGGGVYQGTLNNCTVIGNSASRSDGGVSNSKLNNSIVYYNSAATSNANYFGVLSYCCTTPMPPGGTGNFTNAPLFVNQAGGNFHLQAGSPCINAGLNAYVQGSTDLDGNARIRGGTVDVGAYEFQSPTSIISYAWLQQYGLPMDGSADVVDADIDGLDNWQEWRSGTDPADAASLLKLIQTSSSAGQVTITWASVTNRTYFIERAADLGAAAPFSLLQTNVRGLPGTTSFTDTNAPAPAYYRVGVE